MSVTSLRRQKPTTLQRPVGDGATAVSPTPAEWVRPSAWLSLPDVTGQQMFAGLYLISKDGNFVALRAAGNYTVDWGDGTSTNHTANTTAYKEYNYADISSTGESELGYRQVVITVTPQAGQNFTLLDLQEHHNQTGLNTSYSPLWLDIDVNGSSLTSLTIGGLRQLSALQRATIRNHAITSAVSLFSGCPSLQSVPLFNTSSVTNMDSMFYYCPSLTSVPWFNTSSVTNMSNMFGYCSSLTSVPLFNTSSVTNMNGMFYYCHSLTSVPLFNTSSVTSMSTMFYSCHSLTSVPLFNTSSVTNMTSMFNSCSSLTTVPLFDTSAVTGMVFMLYRCHSLTSVPLFDTSAVTDMRSMFDGCSRLTTVPLFNTAAVMDMGSMFANCFSLKNVPLFNTVTVNHMNNMFSSCYSLTTVSLFNTSSVTNMSNMFVSCYSLTTVPLFNTAAVTNMTSMFYNCYKLTTVPLFDTSSVTSMGSMFYSCTSLTTIPALNANASTTLGTFASGGNISWFDMTNINATISLSSQKLSKAALNHIFTNLLRRTVSTTITISGNYGADTAVSKSSCGTTANSKVVTQADTSNLAIGMRVLGVGVNDAVAVTFQDTGDTVTRNSHGLSDGTIVSFTSITSTTGILTYTQYYVVNSMTNTFQLSETPGGPAIALTTDGSGDMIYPAYITAITPNTSFEMSAPASATGTVTLIARILDTFPAIAKGWTVSG